MYINLLRTYTNYVHAYTHIQLHILTNILTYTQIYKIKLTTIIQVISIILLKMFLLQNKNNTKKKIVKMKLYEFIQAYQNRAEFIRVCLI
jgi:low affinity Fe/Cu permease